MTTHDRTDENSGTHREDASRMASGHSRAAYSAPSLVRLDVMLTALGTGLALDGLDGPNPS
jgi:hypothetical protein